MWKMNCKNVTEHDTALSANETKTDVHHECLMELTSVVPGKGSLGTE